MKTLVTGGAGFIGSHLVDKLIELGHEVGIVDNLRSGKLENLNPKAIFSQIDLSDKESLSSLLEKYQPDIIFHLAAQNEVPFSMEHPFEDAQINIMGMMNLMEAASKAGIKKVVYSNTGGALYGDVEHSDLPIVETFVPIKPTSFYGVSKGAAESYLKLYCNLNNIGWVSLRYSNVYGPRQDGNKEAGIVAIFTHKMLNKEQPRINGNGKHTRDYVYVGDVVAANIKAMNYDKNDYFNIATGVETSSNQVFDILEEFIKTGAPINYGPERPGDPLRNSLNITKAQKLLGWKPQVTFRSGVQKTVEYYQNKN